MKCLTTGYEAFEDWDVDRFQKKNKKHQTTIYFKFTATRSRAFNHQKDTMFNIQLAVYTQPISPATALGVQVE